MTLWLLQADVLEALQAASAASIGAEQTLAFEASARRSVLQAGNQVARIPVVGTLTPRPDLFAFLFGGGNTAYSQIIEALAEADRDPSVASVEMLFDSGGGTVDGLFETLAAIASFSKPISVRASKAASAAYALAAAAGPIEAASAGSVFGSIGVAVSPRISKDTVTLTSTHAPDKRPDLTTDAGKATVIRELDAVHELFVDAIARGRSTTPENVNASFGRGGTFLAREAKSRGLIDSIFEAPKTSRKHTTATKSGGISLEKTMDLTTLKAAHPELYAQVYALGQTAEFERVSAHLKMGEACGDVSIATKAINEKTAFGNDVVQASYMAAGLNKRDIQARLEDSREVAAATSNLAPAAAEKDLGDLVAEALLGKETK